MKKIIIIICSVLLIIGAVIAGFILFKNHDKKETEKVNIVKSEARKLSLVDYDHENFSMKIPEGWEVSTAGDNMYFSIRVFDPNDDRYQIYVILKAEPLLKNYDAKSWYQKYYNSFGGTGNKLLANAIVIEKPTVVDFYSSFNDYVGFAKSMGSTFAAPDLKNFAVIESYDSNSALKSIAKDDKIIRGSFQDSKTNKIGEGLFMASIIDMGSNYTLGYDSLFYAAYNCIGISAAIEEFVNYEELLTESLNSLQYNESFVNQTIKNGEESTKKALEMNASINNAYDSYNKAWSNRQKSYDITSQKNSDATLGYERVYDKDTGEIYKAYNGFTDDYKGDRYEAIDDSMYSEAITGYIEK